MSSVAFVEELKIWLNNDPDRVELLKVEAPIKATTLRLTLKGRYNPSLRLEKGIRNVMQQFPLKQKKSAS